MRAVAAGVVAALALMACGGDGDGQVRVGHRDGAGKTDAGRALAGERREAPVAFEPEAAHTIATGPREWPPVALHGRGAWLADEGGVTVIDVTTGEAVARVEPENTPLYEPTPPEEMSGAEAEELGNRVHGPVVAEIDGETAVLATVPVRLPDGVDGIEVIAVRADDAEVMWRLPVELDEAPDGGTLGAAVWSSAYRDMAALQWTVDGNVEGTMGIDLDERRVMWRNADFWVFDGYGGTLLGPLYRPGTDTYSLAGISLATGEEIWAESWEGEISTDSTGGPWTAVEINDEGPELVEIATGDAVLGGDDGLTGESECLMGAGGSAVVCASDGGAALALDATSGEMLWRQDSWSGEITEAAGDLVYVERDGGTAAVDARTGETVARGDGAAPDLVSPYAGLVFTGDGVDVHLARE